jgi:hypothetical protein
LAYRCFELIWARRGFHPIVAPSCAGCATRRRAGMCQYGHYRCQIMQGAELEPIYIWLCVYLPHSHASGSGDRDVCSTQDGRRSISEWIVPSRGGSLGHTAGRRKQLIRLGAEDSMSALAVAIPHHKQSLPPDSARSGLHRDCQYLITLIITSSDRQRLPDPSLSKATEIVLPHF